MNKILNPNIFFIIITFILLRFIDSELFFKGVIFIIISITLIYLPQKKLNRINLSILAILIIIFSIINEKKIIVEKSGPLKINYQNENHYIELLGIDRFSFIEDYYKNNAKECYLNTLDCFHNNDIKNNYLSPDQLIFNTKNTYSRKVAEIKFQNLADARMSFVNSRSGNVNYRNIFKLDTPYYVEYQNLEHIDSFCFKGLGYIETINSKFIGLHHQYNKCINKTIKSFTGFNLPNHNLQILSSEKTYSKFFDEIIFIVFLVFLIINLNYKKISSRELKIYIPVLVSTFIIFYISRFDNWFNVFNLFNFYFFGFEGGDGSFYINSAHILFESFANLKILDFLRAGEDVFYFTPGSRYFLFLNQLISGDFYYLYFFTLFFLPKIINKFLINQFGEKVGYYMTLSFLLIPFLHHLGISYYQYIRHAYRLFPEPLGYMFFIAGLTIFLHSFRENYLKMNLLFAISVFLRPNLVLSVALIMIIKTFYEKINIFNFKYLIPLFFISLIYFFPLMHNLYFGNSFTLFTEYGSNMMKLENIYNNIDFYFNKYKLINLIFLSLILIPGLNIYLKIILISQLFTVFWFETLGRYYWIYWLVSLNLLYDIFYKAYKNKWQFQKVFTSN